MLPVALYHIPCRALAVRPAVQTWHIHLMRYIIVPTSLAYHN